MKLHFALPGLLFLALAMLSCKKSNQNDCGTPNPDKNLKGCNDFSVHKRISNDMIASVSIDRDKIAFTENFQSFENIVLETFAEVEITQNCEIQKVWSNLCNDAIDIPNCPITFWKLQSGKLEFKTEGEQCEGNTYLATVNLYNATFIKDGSTETQTFEKIEFYHVAVGFGSGG